MISWLVEQAAMMTFITLIIMLIKRYCMSLLGAKLTYSLWLFVPLSILASLLPTVSEENVAASRYIVSLKQANEQVVTQLSGYSEVVIGIWLIAVATFTCITVMQHIKYMHSIKTQALDNADKNTLAEVLENQNLKGVSVSFAKGISSPFVTGLIAPHLVLPYQFFSRFSFVQQQLIIQHELTHIRRGDLVWNALAQLLLIVFWFNPVSWLAIKLFRQSQELACDHTVVALCPKSRRTDYALAMVKCAEPAALIKPTFIHYGEKNMLKERLQNLKQHAPVQRWKGVSVTLALIPVVLAVNLVNARETLSDYDQKVSSFPVSRVEPLYPKEAAEQGIEGSVLIEFDINPDGTVSNVSVLDAEPENVFGHNAKMAVQQWVYEKPSRRLENMLVQLDFALSPESDFRRVNWDENGKRR